MSLRKRAGPAIISRMSALSFHTGPRALAQVRAHGLRAQDVAIVPAAAGGPKGLICLPAVCLHFGRLLVDTSFSPILCSHLEDGQPSRSDPSFGMAREQAV
ncbi:MAG: hypothetical protein ACXWC4_03400 [Telluria sp.]